MQVKHEKIVLFLRTGILWSASFIAILLFVGFCQILHPTPDLTNISMKYLGIYILMMSSVLTLSIYSEMKEEPQIVKYNTSEIEYYLVHRFHFISINFCNIMNII
jgi:hypothetical protein